MGMPGESVPTATSPGPPGVTASTSTPVSEMCVQVIGSPGAAGLGSDTSVNERIPTMLPMTSATTTTNATPNVRARRRRARRTALGGSAGNAWIESARRWRLSRTACSSIIGPQLPVRCGGSSCPETRATGPFQGGTA